MLLLSDDFSIEQMLQLSNRLQQPPRIHSQHLYAQLIKQPQQIVIILLPYLLLELQVTGYKLSQAGFELVVDTLKC